ncbi:MAG TPA: hypothetical protein VEL03_06875 [Streptosporangiaceae bacterium]|nr:hypothetical protein [Streptosporangiaceae bacterium]
MEQRTRRAAIILGTALAGLGLGSGVDGLLAAADKYLTAAYNYGFSPFHGIGSTDAYPVPTLASPIFPIFGAIIGLGIGITVAAFLPTDRC